MKLKHLDDFIAKKYQPLTSEEKIVLIIDQDRFSFFEKLSNKTIGTFFVFHHPEKNPFCHYDDQSSAKKSS